MEDNKMLNRRGIEEWMNHRDSAVFDELFTHDFLWHTTSTTLDGREAIRAFLASFFTAFPDGHFTIEEAITDADTVASRLTFRGTHQGHFMGIPPSGKAVEVAEFAILRIANGRAVEQWTILDTLGMMQQLGVVLAPGQASRDE